jgi:predicted O-methyltransferase YrrM
MAEPNTVVHGSNAHGITQEVQNQFDSVENWITSSLLPHDVALAATIKANAAANLDEIDVSPNEGKQLYLLAKLMNAKRILEVGTLGGYSSIWMSKALPADGKLITLEIDPKHASVARSNIANAGFSHIVDVRLGPALESLEKMGAEEGGVEPFDLVFIDADKQNNTAYFKWALKFSRKGTLIIVDNVVRQGRVVDLDCKVPGVLGVRELFEYLKTEKRVDCTAIQTVGSKDWDGYALCLVVE